MTTPNVVLAFEKPTAGFLCPITANTYGIDFLSFQIRDVDSKKVVFELAKDPDTPAPIYPEDFDYDKLRMINYSFPSDFLRYKNVGTVLRFHVGDNEVYKFRMIERHYFKGKLVKSYDFLFPFCIPNSTNEWDSVYDVPPLGNKMIADMVASPEETESDSFYFVNDKLIMHNKAKYTYEK